jgi:hypothetical protein
MSLIRPATTSLLFTRIMVPSSVAAREPQNLLVTPTTNPGDRDGHPAEEIWKEFQDPAGGAHEGSRFSRKAATPSAASAEANSFWDSSVVRVNAAPRSIPGIV